MSTTIVQLRAENIKRLKAVCITPTGAIVTVGGRNAQGKTSVLDAIMMALAGTKSAPSKPVRDGEKKGTIVLETQEIRVTRKFNATGTTALEVTNLEGLSFPSPQAVLDKLCATLSFDPLQFVRLGDTPEGRRQQLQRLRDLAGVDTTEIDAQRKAVFDQRTEINREVKRQEGLVASLPMSGPARVDTAAVLEEMTAAEKRNDALRVKINELAEARRDLSQADLDISNAEKAAGEANSAVRKLELTLKAAQELAAQKMEAVGAARRYRAELAGNIEVVDADPAPELEGLSKHRQILRDAETTNAAAAKVEQRKVEADKLRDLEKKAADKTAQLEKIEADRLALTKSAKFPIEDLDLGESGVLYKGLPLEQASSAEQLRVGLAVACTINPSLKVMLIRDGSLLDDDSLKLVAEMAEKNGAQVWLEKVGNDGKCTVVIEDGEVVEQNLI